MAGIRDGPAAPRSAGRISRQQMNIVRVWKDCGYGVREIAKSEKLLSVIKDLLEGSLCGVLETCRE